MNPQTLTDEQLSLVMSAIHGALAKANMKEPGFALEALRTGLMVIADEGHGTDIDRALWVALGGGLGSTAEMVSQLIAQRDILQGFAAKVVEHNKWVLTDDQHYSLPEDILAMVDATEGQPIREAYEELKKKHQDLIEENAGVRQQAGGMQTTIDELIADKNAYAQNAIDLREQLDASEKSRKALLDAENKKPGKRHSMSSVIQAIQNAGIRVMTSNDCHRLAMSLNYIAHDVVLDEPDPVTNESRLSAIEKLKQAQDINNTLQKLTGQGTVSWHRHETIDDRIHEALEKLGD